MKYILSVIFLYFILTQVGYAQTKTIYGSVTDFNNRPISNVLVSTLDSSIITQTDQEGRFSITIDSISEFLLFKHKHYVTKKSRISSTQDQNIRLDFNTETQVLIGLSLDELLSIQVTAPTSTSQTLKKAPATISVITKNQIKERGYQSVGEAINSIAGIYVLNDYMQYNVGIRGVNGGMRSWSRILKIMINGQAVSFRPSSEGYLGEELIPLATIERIEVIKGPASALYGANAFLGVVNIITTNSNDILSGEANAKFETGKNMSGKGVSFLVDGKFKKASYLISSSYKNADRSGLNPIDVPGKNVYSNRLSENDMAKPTSFYSKIEYNDIKSGNFSFDLSYQNLNTYGEFSDWGVLTHKNQIHQVNYYSRIKYSKEWFENFSTNASITHSKSILGENDKLAIDTTSSWITRDVGCEAFDFMLNTDYSIKKESNIKVGIDFTNENNNLLTYYLNQPNQAPIPQQGKEFGDTIFKNTGIFMQAILDPSELMELESLNGLGITCGLRYDLQNIYGNIFNYRVAAVYTFNSSIYSKLLYGTSYKAPSAVQLYSNYIKVGDVIGNPNLKPEKAQTIEWVIGLQPSKTININTTTFYNIINNKVELVYPIGTISNISYGNVSKINSAGIEIEILQNIRNWMNYANISYQRSILSKEDLTKNEINQKTDLFPDIMVKMGSNLAIPKYFLNLNIEGAYISSRIASQQNSYIYDPVNFRTNRYELPAYFILDMTISSLNLKFIKNSETRLTLKANNLLNSKAAWPGYKDFDVPFMGTNFMFSLTQKF